MNYPCDKCGTDREACNKCGIKDSEFCAKCSNKLRIHDGKTICPKCMRKHKCPEQGCSKLKQYRCKRKWCRNNSAELDKCMDHHKNLGICDQCLDGARCNKCNELNIDTWTHLCGQFCTNCVKQVIVDISPFTLSRLLPYGHPRKTGCCTLIGIYKTYCERCLAGKTVKDLQLEEMWKEYGPMDQENEEYECVGVGECVGEWVAVAVGVGVGVGVGMGMGMGMAMAVGVAVAVVTVWVTDSRN